MVSVLCVVINVHPEIETRSQSHDLSLHCALSLAAQCIVIGPVCNGRAAFVALSGCYHDKSKLRATIFTKLGL